MGRFLNAAEIVLRRARRPMNVKEITDDARLLGELDFSNGDTPSQTMKAKLSVDIRRFGSRSRFKRVAPGTFALRNDLALGEYLARPYEKNLSPGEDVLVFPVSELDKIGRFQGVSRNVERYKRLLSPAVTKFIPRLQAEVDTEHKQIVSYVLVRHGRSILRFMRGTYTSVRNYLGGLQCIAFGGHVQSADRDAYPLFTAGDSGYLESARRELNEELNIGPEIWKLPLKTIGVLNDDSSPLGKVHFAFVHMLDISSLKLTNVRELKRERSISQLALVPIKNLGSEFEKYEYWSKLCIKTFFFNRVSLSCRIHPIRHFKLHRHRQCLVVIGGIGSGKTEVSKLLSDRFGYRLVSSSGALERMLGTKMTALGRSDFQARAAAFIATAEGPSRLAGALVEQMGNAETVVIDGVRNEKTFDELVKLLPERPTLIYVESTVDTAYRFFKAREAPTLSMNAFLELWDHPVEREIGRLGRRADIVIHNNGSKQNYIRTVTTFFREELSA